MRRPTTISPWTVLTLLGCAGLAGIDAWREAGTAGWPLLRGILPNVLAVPVLTFGALMLRFIQRTEFSEARLKAQDRTFRWAWSVTLLITVLWEFTQRHGALVFDPLDLVATFVGAAAAVLLYRQFRLAAFIREST